MCVSGMLPDCAPTKSDLLARERAILFDGSNRAVNNVASENIERQSRQAEKP